MAATWKLLARGGLRAANMRALAAEAGYANGALAYYFAGKDDLVRAAYEYVLKQTMLRIAAATAELQGLAALRAFAAEVLPGDEAKLLEARIVIPFWEAALQERKFEKLHEQGIDAWRKQIGRHLRESEHLGEIGRQTASTRAVAVEHLIAILNGAQVLGLISADVHTVRMQKRVIETFFDGLR